MCIKYTFFIKYFNFVKIGYNKSKYISFKYRQKCLNIIIHTYKTKINNNISLVNF